MENSPFNCKTGGIIVVYGWAITNIWVFIMLTANIKPKQNLIEWNSVHLNHAKHKKKEKELKIVCCEVNRMAQSGSKKKKLSVYWCHNFLRQFTDKIISWNLMTHSLTRSIYKS